MPSVFKFNGNEIIDSSGKVTTSAFPTNSILQLKHATRTTSYSDTSVDNNYTNIPSFEVSITPSSTLNKILVIANLRASNNNAGSHNGMVLRFRRSINDASYQEIGNVLQTNIKDGYGYAITHVLTHIDTPNTIQKVEYSVGYADVSTAFSSELYIGTNLGGNSEPVSESVIMAMELKT